MRTCPGCGAPASGGVCPLCHTEIPDRVLMPVCTGGMTPVSGAAGGPVSLSDLLSAHAGAPRSHLLFGPANAGGLCVLAAPAVQDAHIDIPAAHQGRPVTGIGEAAFCGMALCSVHIPDTVQRIGNRAFENCANLKTVSGCRGVERIGSRAFAGCARLTHCTFHAKPAAAYDSFAGCYAGGMQIETQVNPGGERS